MRLLTKLTTHPQPSQLVILLISGHRAGLAGACGLKWRQAFMLPDLMRAVHKETS